MWKNVGMKYIAYSIVGIIGIGLIWYFLTAPKAATKPLEDKVHSVTDPYYINNVKPLVDQWNALQKSGDIQKMQDLYSFIAKNYPAYKDMFVMPTGVTPSAGSTTSK